MLPDEAGPLDHRHDLPHRLLPWHEGRAESLDAKEIRLAGHRGECPARDRGLLKGHSHQRRLVLAHDDPMLPGRHLQRAVGVLAELGHRVSVEKQRPGLNRRADQASRPIDVDHRAVGFLGRHLMKRAPAAGRAPQRPRNPADHVGSPSRHLPLQDRERTRSRDPDLDRALVVFDRDGDRDRAAVDDGRHLVAGLFPNLPAMGLQCAQDRSLDFLRRPSGWNRDGVGKLGSGRRRRRVRASENRQRDTERRDGNVPDPDENAKWGLHRSKCPPIDHFHRNAATVFRKPRIQTAQWVDARLGSDQDRCPPSRGIRDPTSTAQAPRTAHRRTLAS